MRPIDYWHFQLRLEGLRLTADGSLAQAAPGGEELPLALLVRAADGESRACFSVKLPEQLRDELSSGDPDALSTELVLSRLQEGGIKATAETFKTYIFPNSYSATQPKGVVCLDPGDPKVTAFGFGGLASRVHVVEEDGRVASACASSRQDVACGEAWVMTAPDHRRKGLAQRVTAAWAGRLLRDGLIPFYSHRIENEASAGLASCLELLHVFDETVILERPRQGQRD